MCIYVCILSHCIYFLCMFLVLSFLSTRGALPNFTVPVPVLWKIQIIHSFNFHNRAEFDRNNNNNRLNLYGAFLDTQRGFAVRRGTHSPPPDNNNPNRRVRAELHVRSSRTALPVQRHVTRPDVWFWVKDDVQSWFKPSWAVHWWKPSHMEITVQSWNW